MIYVFRLELNSTDLKEKKRQRENDVIRCQARNMCLRDFTSLILFYLSLLANKVPAVAIRLPDEQPVHAKLRTRAGTLEISHPTSQGHRPNHRPNQTEGEIPPKLASDLVVLALAGAVAVGVEPDDVGQPDEGESEDAEEEIFSG